MYYDFSRVIDRVIYRYQRVYSHFRIPFPFDYSILFSLHRSYLSLLNAQKLKKKSGKEKIPASIFLSPFPKRRRNETFANVLTIDAREFSRVHRGEKRFHMTKRCPISFVSNGTRKHQGWPKFFP